MPPKATLMLSSTPMGPQPSPAPQQSPLGTGRFPVLRDAVKQRLSLSHDEAVRLIEEWRAHSCLTWLLSREPQSEPPPTLAGLKLYAMRGIPDEYRPEVPITLSRMLCTSSVSLSSYSPEKQSHRRAGSRRRERFGEQCKP